MEAKFTYKFRLDGRRKFEDGTYPIKVNIHNATTNVNRDYSFYNKSHSLKATKTDFESIWTNRFKYDNFGDVSGETTVHGKKLELRTKLKLAANKFDEIITRKNIQSHQDVLNAYLVYRESSQYSGNIKNAFEYYIENLEREGRYKTAKSFRTTLNNIIKHYDGSFNDNIQLIDIDKDWLNSFDRERRTQGIAAASVGVDTRNIRTVMNKNYDETFKKLYYPFGKGKYQPPTSQAKNQGLEKKDLKKILNFKSNNTHLQEARDYFMFTYFAGGMNFKDIALLKKDQTSFIRSKTKFTSKNETKIELEFNQHQLDIIERNKGKEYLFKILDGITDKKIIQKAIDNNISRIDKQLKKLAKGLDIKHSISLNWARHSFATNLFDDDVNLKAISEILGHTSLKTTEGYIDSLVDKNKSKIKDALDLDD